MSAIGAWLASEGVALLLGALAKLVMDGWNSYQSNNALREAGASKTAAKINAKTVETQDAIEGVARPSDDDVARSLQSGKF